MFRGVFRIVLAALVFACFFASSCAFLSENPVFRPAAAEAAHAAHAAPGVPAAPVNILGTGKTDSKALARFLVRSNPFIKESYAEDFARIYIEEAALEGVNHDVAFSQMCLETGYLSFRGLVKPEMNNYCGLGSLGHGAAGESFPTPRIGVRAQIQHLKIYATGEPLRERQVDPRRKFVRPGSAKTIYELSGLWAADREYGRKIKRILDRLYSASF